MVLSLGSNFGMKKKSVGGGGKKKTTNPCKPIGGRGGTSAQKKRDLPSYRTTLAPTQKKKSDRGKEKRVAIQRGQSRGQTGKGVYEKKNWF